MKIVYIGSIKTHPLSLGKETDSDLSSTTFAQFGHSSASFRLSKAHSPNNGSAESLSSAAGFSALPKILNVPFNFQPFPLNLNHIAYLKVETFG